MELSCPQCGAAVAPPTDIDARTATCGHCRAPVALPAEWVARQERARAARDRRAHDAATRAEQRRDARLERRTWIFLFGGIAVLVVGFTAFILIRAASQTGGTTTTTTTTQPQITQALRDAGERVRQRIIALDAQGCDHVVAGATIQLGQAEHVLDMAAGGNCLRAIAASPAMDRLSAKLSTPAGAVVGGAVVDGLLEIEHCPVDSGQHEFSASAPELAYGLVDCPPAREKHRDDPAKNGMALVGGRMEQLKKAGCKTVLMPPKTQVGPQTMTATMEPGRYCAVIIAGSVNPDNSLTASLSDPFGKAIEVPAPAPFVEIAHCAADAGPHALAIEPSMLDYYAIGAMDCPKRVATRRPARE